MANKSEHKRILVFAHWSGLAAPLEMGVLHATISRGKEIFSEVRKLVNMWREIAARNGISKTEQDAMVNAFSRAF